VPARVDRTNQSPPGVSWCISPSTHHGISLASRASLLPTHRAAVPLGQTHPVKVMEKLSPVDESLSVTAAFPGQDLSLLCTIFLGALRARGSVCNAVLSAIALRRAVFSAERATGNHVPPCPLGP